MNTLNDSESASYDAMKTLAEAVLQRHRHAAEPEQPAVPTRPRQHRRRRHLASYLGDDECDPRPNPW
jgi:hypothetical protein